MLSQSQNAWKMYEKIFSNVFFSMMPPYDENLRYINVVEFNSAYFLVEDNFKI